MKLKGVKIINPADRISLYQCGNARVRGDRIYCAARHPLSFREDGTIDIIRLQLGMPLVMTICQGCADLDYLSDNVPRGERGWERVG